MLFRTLLISLILALLIALGIGYTWQQLVHPSTLVAAADQADAYATHVVTEHMDTEGRLRDRLRTPLSVHYSKDDSISLAAPVFNFFLKNGELWELSARYGKLRGDHDLLQLWDGVTLKQRKRFVYSPVSTLTTATVSIHLKEETADTDSPVTITQKNQIIHAVGFHADLRGKTVQLLSQVQGRLKTTKQ